jgi:hypothetical protein
MLYRAHVIGHLWSGARATYTYAFEAPAGASDKSLRLLAGIAAGDFESVEDEEVWAHEVCVSCGEYHWEVRVPWQCPAHGAEYAEITYGRELATP